MQNYNARQAAELLGVSYHAFRKRLERDSKKSEEKRKYPGAFKSKPRDRWLIPATDLNLAIPCAE
jgi:hypothetical protein